MAEIPTLYAQRPIIYRQDKSGFYHPFVEALAFTLVDVPFSAATSIVFSLIVYFMIGFQKSAVCEAYFLYDTHPNRLFTTGPIPVRSLTQIG